MTLLKKLLKPLVPKTAKNRNHHVKERHRKHSWYYFYYLCPPARSSSSRPRETRTSPKISPHHLTMILSTSQALCAPLLNSSRNWAQIHLHMTNTNTSVDCWRDLTSISVSDTWLDARILAENDQNWACLEAKINHSNALPADFEATTINHNTILMHWARGWPCVVFAMPRILEERWAHDFWAVVAGGTH